MIFRQSLTKLQRLLLWFYSKKVAILFGCKKLLNSWGLILLWVLFAVCEVCASVRSPSRSSGHLSVAVQWCVQCCTAQYSAGYSQGSVSSPSLRSDCAVSWTGVTREKSFAELMWMETQYFRLGGHGWQMISGACKKKAALSFVSWLWASQASAQPGHSPPARLKLSNGLEKGNWKWLRKTLREKLSSEFPMSKSQDAEYPEN